jgi:hypothetical protein
MRPEDDGRVMAAAVNVQTIIDELKSSLECVTSEEKLFHLIAERVPALRRSFRAQKSLFTPNHIEFLTSVAAVADQLQSFIAIKEELADVGTVEDHKAMVSRLARIKARLGPFAVCRRVMRELRELDEKLPIIRQLNNGKWRVRVDTRIVDLEQQSPRRCERNHAMVIREGPYDYYWGCSRYPFCGDAARLTPGQRSRLGS